MPDIERGSDPRAGDIMTRDVIALPESVSVLEAAFVLLDRKVSGAPVVGGGGHLVGVLTEDDLAGLFYEGGADLASTSIGACEVPGTSLVTRKVITVRPETSAREAAKVMMIKKIKRLPVVDAAGRIVGILRARQTITAPNGSSSGGPAALLVGYMLQHAPSSRVAVGASAYRDCRPAR